MKIDIVRPQQEKMIFNNGVALRNFFKAVESDGDYANFELTALDGSYKALIIDCYDFGLKVDRTVVFDTNEEINSLELTDIADFECIFPCELKRIDKDKIRIIIEIED